MSRFIDLKNQKFGKLKVLSRSENIGGRTAWNCICDCGKSTTVRSYSLRGKDTKSCGCINIETSPRKSHGLTNHLLYNTWLGLNKRCNNKNDPKYKNYGGRGIKVCKRWLHSFPNFLSDMGERPNGLTLDRIDNDGNYEKSNCRWATSTQQKRNTRTTINLTFNGKTQCLFVWARECHLDYNCLYARLKRGWSVEKTLTTISRRR